MSLKENINKQFEELLKKSGDMWDSLNPKAKKGIIVSAIVTGIGSGAVVMTKVKEVEREKRTVIEERHEVPKSLEVPQDWLEKSRLEKAQNEAESYKKKLTEKNLEAEEKEQSLEEWKAQALKEIKKELNDPSLVTNESGKPGAKRYPQPPGSNRSNQSLRPVPKNISKEGVKLEGGIGRVSASPSAAEENSGEKIDETKGTYLPMSFMEATLLSGVDAPVMEQGKANPVPVLMMIKSPAFLPNKVKKDLKGCFVTAEGYGSLATERVNLLLDRISCVKNDGSSFIEEKIKGYVLDSDGKLGLKGQVVAKFGTKLFRTFLAGAFEGAGETMSQSATATTTDVTGATTQSVDKEQMQTAMVGKGLSSASKKVSEFYMTLAEQSLPVVEIGIKDKITIVVREGLTLNFRSEVK